MKGSSVSISTLPANGPFYVGQTVQFTCETNTTMSISYQWNYNNRIYHSYTRTGQSIYVTFDQSYLRYFWIFCTASSSGVILGKANTFFEINGKLLESVKLPLYCYYLLGWLHYTSPRSQTFATNQTVTMSISVHNNYYEWFFITSLSPAWYHNGSRIEVNDRIDIINNKTTLTISKSKHSDAGKYEVRIDSLTFGNRSYPECDQLLLLENFAPHNQATFFLQQNTLPRYNPEDMINNYFITSYVGDDQQTFITNYTGTINSNLYQNGYHSYRTYKDGQYFYHGSSSFHYNMDNYFFNYNISYSNSQDVVGHYIQIHYYYYYSYNQAICSSYLKNFRYHNDYVPILIRYWTISSQCKYKVSFSLDYSSSYALLLQLLLSSLPPLNQCLCC